MKITIEQTETGWRAEIDKGGMTPSHVTVESDMLAALFPLILAEAPGEQLTIFLDAEGKCIRMPLAPESDAPPPVEPPPPVQAAPVEQGASDATPETPPADPEVVAPDTTEAA